MSFDPSFARFVWEISVTVALAIAGIYAWQAKRTGARATAIEDIDRRLIKIEANQPGFVYRSEHAALSAGMKAEMTSINTSLGRIETQLDQLRQVMLDGDNKK